MPDLKVAVGLGNPGERYSETRHNAGYAVADRLAKVLGVTWRAEADWLEALAPIGAGELLLVKPTTFMNDSGRAVAGILQRCCVSLQDILVLVDDVHLGLGRVRVRRRGSDGGHNGLRSVILSVGGPDFPRVRLGIGGPAEGQALIDYVLGRFHPDQLDLVDRLVECGSEAASCWCVEGVDAAMNRFNGL